MDQQDKTWHLIDAFLDFSLLSLNDYNVKLPTFTSVKKTMFLFAVNLGIQLQKN